MTTSRTILKSARLFHLYSGVFFTPALLFFAFTGSVQSMNFHETTRGSNYKPPAILVKLAQLHKKETLVLPERKGPPPNATTANTAPQEAQSRDSTSLKKPPMDPSHLGDHTNQQKHDRLERTGDPGSTAVVPRTGSSPEPKRTEPAPPEKTPKTLPLKIFSFWAGVGLFLSTLTGLYMSYTFTRNKIAISATLAAGLVLPLLLLALQ